MCLILYNECVVKVTLTLEADVINLYLEMRRRRLSKWRWDLEQNPDLARPCSLPPCWLLLGDSELHSCPSEGSSPQIPTVSLPFQLYSLSSSPAPSPCSSRILRSQCGPRSEELEPHTITICSGGNGSSPCLRAG